jgi:hypothetical protein
MPRSGSTRYAAVSARICPLSGVFLTWERSRPGWLGGASLAYDRNMSEAAVRTKLTLAVNARRMLTVATILAPLALASCGPIAFGMLMTTDDPDSQLGSADNAMLALLAVVVGILISTLVLGWVFAYRRQWQSQAWWSSASIATSALVIGTIIYEVSSGR